MDDARIAGVVYDSSGAPVSGAVVALGGASPPHPDIGAVTGADGRYQFSGLAPGDYTVIVNVAGHPLVTGQVTAAGGRTGHLDLTLPPPA